MHTYVYLHLQQTVSRLALILTSLHTINPHNISTHKMSIQIVILVQLTTLWILGPGHVLKLLFIQLLLKRHSATNVDSQYTQLKIGS